MIDKEVSKCESSACVEVTRYKETLRWHSNESHTNMQTPLAEAAELIARIKAGKLDYLLEDAAYVAVAS